MTWLLKMITGNPVTLIYLAAGIFLTGIASGGSGAWWIQGLRLNSAKAATKTVQAAFDVFKGDVKAKGEIAQQKAAEQAAKDLQAKEKADHENKTTVARLNQRIASLRYDREHSGSYDLPKASPTAKRPDLLCFDRAEFSRAGGTVLGELRAIADKGDAATVSLNTACEWAVGR